MKIAIVGGGISGCAIYLALKKRLPQPPASMAEHEFVIFESYDTTRNLASQHAPGDTHSASLIVGGGIGLHPNGVRSLERLNEDLARDVKLAGHCFNVQKFMSSYGRELARLPCSSEDTYSISLSRHALWSCLRNYVPDDLIVTKRVTQVIANSNGRSVIQFADGSPDEEADLVIGADGLKSPTRRALFPEAKEDPYPPEFAGLVGVGGVVQGEEFKSLVEPCTINFVFGRNGFFGYSFVQSLTNPSEYISSTSQSKTTPSDTVMWWSTYEMESCPDPRAVDKEAILRDLHNRLDTWKDPIIQKILGTVNIQTIFPVNTTPELPTWTRDGVIVIGDAAHTLTPTSGQGTCQALEDVECFSMLLSHFLNKTYDSLSDPSAAALARIERETIAQVMQKHMEIRKPRVHAIQEKGKQFDQKKKNLGRVAEFMMYFGLFIMGKLPMPSWMTGLWTYDIANEVNYEISKMEAENHH
ncbi:FAD binding domain containing protein [Coccidioides posadasii C735 delta SOWgp]|uniref:FAD-binding domain-containing protein n=2 Tax=Coccidioides posadasii TaxID=199306 RepID=A0A0J6FHW0_COCPO|nr:FAD binding domain containing protein [Coccidioides posadasii C735 delta SOWgp]EER29647.1 FAD binding domain containing protein [Coccidioides posadasii C735 delta SOWgp]KMM69908.1 hypothetical protein CPAG_06221 [Coccidioides posadasii RMSCC 3488]|eukprot:XP_003071792.1 FAD binding domain containing protein [Coccidioides posadasii C735 delta SOWgp]